MRERVDREVAVRSFSQGLHSTSCAFINYHACKPWSLPCTCRPPYTIMQCTMCILCLHANVQTQRKSTAVCSVDLVTVTFTLLPLKNLSPSLPFFSLQKTLRHLSGRGGRKRREETRGRRRSGVEFMVKNVHASFSPFPKNATV